MTSVGYMEVCNIFSNKKMFPGRFSTKQITVQLSKSSQDHKKRYSNLKLQNGFDSNADACDSTSVGFTTSTITMYYTMMVRAHSKSLYIRPVLSYICKRRANLKSIFFSSCQPKTISDLNFDQ